MWCIAECGIRVAVCLAKFLDDVRELAGVCPRRLGLYRLLAIDNWIKRLILDPNEAGCVLRRIAGLGNNHGDGLADENHFIFRQGKWGDVRWQHIEAQFERHTVLSQLRPHIVESQHRADARGSARRTCVDRPDLRMRE